MGRRGRWGRWGKCGKWGRWGFLIMILNCKTTSSINPLNSSIAASISNWSTLSTTNSEQGIVPIVKELRILYSYFN